MAGRVTGPRVGVAVVGAGMAGHGHAHGFRNARLHPGLADVDVDLVAVVDPEPGRAAALASRFGFARAVASVDELPDGVTAVAVAVPNDAYVAVVPALLGRGCHVLAEKPLGRDAAEAAAFVRAAE